MGQQGRMDEFRHIFAESDRIVGFTGAGISTGSGIPDYRSQGGIWDKFQPVYLEEFIADESKRKLYWERKQALWQGIESARPGVTHNFFRDLDQQGRLAGLITQNIDGLHEKSGLPAELIVNLHGTNLETTCLDCGYLVPTGEIMAGLDLQRGAPRCPDCDGLLKPNTISFGQALNQVDLARAETMATSCDLMIAAGSTLLVQPAASLPLIAKNNGAKLVIITLSETPLDQFADLVFHEKLEDFFARL